MAPVVQVSQQMIELFRSVQHNFEALRTFIDELHPKAEQALEDYLRAAGDDLRLFDLILAAPSMEEWREMAAATPDGAGFRISISSEQADPATGLPERESACFEHNVDGEWLPVGSLVVEEAVLDSGERQTVFRTLVTDERHKAMGWEYEHVILRHAAAPGRAEGFFVMAHSPRSEIVKAPRKIAARQEQVQLLFKSTLMVLVSNFEVFVGRLMRVFLSNRRDRLLASGHAFTLGELREFDSIRDAEDFLIDRHVESTIRNKSAVDWLGALKDELNIGTDYLDADDVDRLVEICQRRNCVVHNECRIGRDYLKKVPARLRTGVESDDAIVLDGVYLRQAIDHVEALCYLLMAESWDKLEKKSTGRAAWLVETPFQCLRDQQYRVAERLGRYGSRDPRMDRSHRQICTVNWWIAKKALGAWDEIEPEVRGWDISGWSQKFESARLALLEDAAAAAKATRRAILGEEIPKSVLIEWPLFMWVRDSEPFEELRREFDLADHSDGEE